MDQTDWAWFHVRCASSLIVLGGSGPLWCCRSDRVGGAGSGGPLWWCYCSGGGAIVAIIMLWWCWWCCHGGDVDGGAGG
jgi:hypothetical protein